MIFVIVERLDSANGRNILKICFGGVKPHIEHLPNARYSRCIRDNNS